MLKNEESILDVFFKNKCRIKELYELYSRKFPEAAGLWRSLATAEAGHMKVLSDLRIKFRRGNAFFIISKHAGQITGYIGDFIEARLKQAHFEKMSLEDALASALRIERSLLEKKPLEIFKPLLRDIEEAFLRLNRETDHHIKLLEEAVGKNGRRRKKTGGRSAKKGIFDRDKNY